MSDSTTTQQLVDLYNLRSKGHISDDEMIERIKVMIRRSKQSLLLRLMPVIFTIFVILVSAVFGAFGYIVAGRSERVASHHDIRLLTQDKLSLKCTVVDSGL